MRRTLAITGIVLTQVIFHVYDFAFTRELCDSTIPPREIKARRRESLLYTSPRRPHAAAIKTLENTSIGEKKQRAPLYRLHSHDDNKNNVLGIDNTVR